MECGRYAARAVQDAYAKVKHLAVIDGFLTKASGYPRLFQEIQPQLVAICAVRFVHDQMRLRIFLDPVVDGARRLLQRGSDLDTRDSPRIAE